MSSLALPVITTERLRLRPFTADDTAAKFAIFSDPQVARYWSTEPWTDIAQAEAAIADALAGYRDGTDARFAIGLRATGKVFGHVSLHHFFRQNRRCEIGYALASTHWGQGYATEALQAALDYGFRELDLNRVEADIDPGNLASARLLERLGFRKEGYMPERWFVHGQMADTVFYGLLKRYWQAR